MTKLAEIYTEQTCARFNCPHTVRGRTPAEAQRNARDRGWIQDGDGGLLCTIHQGRRAKR